MHEHAKEVMVARVIRAVGTKHKKAVEAAIGHACDTSYATLEKYKAAQLDVDYDTLADYLRAVQVGKELAPEEAGVGMTKQQADAMFGGGYPLAYKDRVAARGTSLRGDTRIGIADARDLLRYKQKGHPANTQDS